MNHDLKAAPWGGFETPSIIQAKMSFKMLKLENFRKKKKKNLQHDKVHEQEFVLVSLVRRIKNWFIVKRKIK